MHTRDLTRFLAELAENNNRAWFVMNKPRYDILRLEFLELVTRLIGEITKFDPAVADCNARRALFRINRDMRFAKDKRPYKTHFSASITATGLKKPSQGGGPAYYFHINEQSELLVAAGEYCPPADRLRAIREGIVSDPKGFQRALEDKRLRQRFGNLKEEGKLVRLPKGFEEHAALAEYLKHKSYIIWNASPLRAPYPVHLDADLVAMFRDAAPLVNWLRKQ